jgi:anti-sigma factor RsiW
MACDNARELLHGYLDGELDLATNLDLQRHLQECAACAKAYQAQQGLRAAIHQSDLPYKAPSDLGRRIRAATRKAEAASPSHRTVFPLRWLAIAASIVIAALVLWRFGSTRSRADYIEQAVVNNHVRSLMANHLTDVVSTDSHTVKPWFAGKLDFSPPVKDLAAQGFPLAGGRLEYIDRPVAALVYKRRLHIINVLIWPDTNNAQPPGKPISIQGYNLVHWTEGSMNYWAVSDLNKAELLQFVQLLQP